MSTPSTRIAFVGLGQMGFVMAGRLAEAGYPLTVWDLNPAACERFAQEHEVRVASAANDIADADVAILMLPTSATVQDVILDRGLLEALPAGGLVIDMSSSDPATNVELNRTVREAGRRMLDAPVSGGVSGARAGSLTIMVGGEAADLEQAHGILEVLGGNVVHAGAPGAGDALKALNNLLSAANLLATSEAVVIGAKFGLDPRVMIEAIDNSSGRSWASRTKFPNFIFPGTYDSGFALSLLVKDLKIAVSLAEQMEVPAGHSQATLEGWSSAMASLEDEADHTDIYRWVEGQASDVPG